MKTSKNKTETLKQRAIYVYLPSSEMAEEWKRRANEEGVSISKCVVERVGGDLSREEEDKERCLTRLELINRLKEADEEIKRLNEENRLLRRVVESLDSELRMQRAREFIVDDFQGKREIERELVELLKSGKTLSESQILGGLNIKPEQVELIKAIRNELYTLASYGIVENSPRGWRWKG